MNLYRMLIHIYVISEFVSLSFLVMISDTLEYTGRGGGGRGLLHYKHIIITQQPSLASTMLLCSLHRNEDRHRIILEKFIKYQ